MPGHVWHKHLDTVGNGTGSILATGNYSSVAETFCLIPANTIDAYSLSVVIEDTTGMQAQKYGTMTALTNGIDIELRESDDTLIEQFNDGHSIKNNAHWAMCAFDVNFLTFTSGSNDVMTGMLRFGEGLNALRIYAGQKLVVALNDDFSGLVQHSFMVIGSGKVRA